MDQAQNRLRLIQDFYSKNPALDINYKAESGEIVYDTLVAVPGLTKARIAARLKEYVAIHYGNIAAVLHFEDFENGRIICKGNVRTRISLESMNFWNVYELGFKELGYLNRAWFTLIIYLDEGVARFSIEDVCYDFARELPMTSFFPLAMNKTVSEIKASYSLTENTNAILNAELGRMTSFLERTNEDDKWHE